MLFWRDPGESSNSFCGSYGKRVEMSEGKVSSCEEKCRWKYYEGEKLPLKSCRRR